MKPTFISDAYLLDFYEKRTQANWVSIRQAFDDYKKCWNERLYYKTSSMSKILKDSKRINKLIKDDNKSIYKILKVGRGKISVYGVATTRLLAQDYINNYEICFHSCTISEANYLLEKSIEILHEDPSISEQSVYYSKETNCVMLKYVKIHLEVYENRNQILRNNGPTSQKHGYDLEVGYFGTTSSSVLLLAGFLCVTTDTMQCCFDENKEVSTLNAFHDINNVIMNDCNEVCIDMYFLGSTYNEIFLVKRIVEEDINYSEHTNFLKTTLFTPLPSTKIDFKKYLGEDCKSIIIGISDDRFIAFYNCKNFFGISKDIFYYICDCWLEIEAEDAKKRLLLSF